ncbi:MAG: hypothetical protein LKI80_04045 [Sporolactobacillus sp.]|nr:hypothetical protein [Sporolactobacillus sp.]
MKIFIVARRATLPRQLSACRGLSWAASLIARIGAIGDKRSLSEQLTAIRTINRQSGWIFAGTDRPSTSVCMRWPITTSSCGFAM